MSKEKEKSWRNFCGHNFLKRQGSFLAKLPLQMFISIYPFWNSRVFWMNIIPTCLFIRLARTSQCGVNSTPMDGTACVNGPGTDQQTVCGMCGMLLDATYPLGVKQNKM